MQNARLDEAQAGIKIARRNINNLRYMTSLVAQMVKHLPTMQETRVWSLSQEDPLEKEMATDSSTLAWKIPWMEEPCRLQSMGLQRVRQDWATSLLLFSDMLMALPLMAESEEELKSLWMKGKEESEKAGLKLNIQKTKVTASGPITSWQTGGENVETVRFHFLGLQNHCRWWLQLWN